MPTSVPAPPVTPDPRPVKPFEGKPSPKPFDIPVAPTERPFDKTFPGHIDPDSKPGGVPKPAAPKPTFPPAYVPAVPAPPGSFPAGSFPFGPPATTPAPVTTAPIFPAKK